MANKLIRKEYCFLTPEANDALLYLRKVGIEDQDFALALLEKLALDEDIYELEFSPYALKDRP